ncbi:ATP-binding protein [Streptomyces sp. WAC 06738]|nr:ATP-binding protein [Streptomyces sp. WAC 06738]
MTFHGVRSSAVDDAVLAASELVGNAVEHAIGPYELWLRQTGRDLIVEMHDRDASLPCIPASFLRAAVAAAAREGGPLPRALGLDAERGRGLLVVEALTGGSWGFRLVGGSGRDVWKKVAWMSVPS